MRGDLPLCLGVTFKGNPLPRAWCGTFFPLEPLNIEVGLILVHTHTNAHEVSYKPKAKATQCVSSSMQKQGRVEGWGWRKMAEEEKATERRKSIWNDNNNNNKVLFFLGNTNHRPYIKGLKFYTFPVFFMKYWSIRGYTAFVVPITIVGYYTSPLSGLTRAVVSIISEPIRRETLSLCAFFFGLSLRCFHIINIQYNNWPAV